MIVKELASVKPMSMLVHNYTRVALCEHILMKLWHGILGTKQVDGSYRL